MFKSLVKNNFMDSVIENANSGLLLESVVENIKNTMHYDMCNIPGNELSELFRRIILFTDINIVVYKPFNRFTRAIGYFDRSSPDIIFVNYYKFYKLSVFRAVSLLFHEAGHLMDNYYHGCDCHHGNNSPIGKEYTFQYSLNRYVLDFFGNEQFPVGYKQSIWKRFLKWLKTIF